MTFLVSRGTRLESFRTQVFVWPCVYVPCRAFCLHDCFLFLPAVPHDSELVDFAWSVASVLADVLWHTHVGCLEKTSRRRIYASGKEHLAGADARQVSKGCFRRFVTVGVKVGRESVLKCLLRSAARL